MGDNNSIINNIKFFINVLDLFTSSKYNSIFPILQVPK